MTSKLRIATACLSLAAGGALVAIASPAQAFDFTSGDALGGCSVLVDNFTTTIGAAKFDDTTTVSNCTTADGFTLNVDAPADGYLHGKKVNGQNGVGITSAGGPTIAEIGGRSVAEIMGVSVPEPRVLDELGLSFLYYKPHFGDVVNEQALVWVSDALYGVLSVTSESEATWKVFQGSLEVAALGKTIAGNSAASGPGYYNILNPFGDLEVAAFQLLAPELLAGADTAGDTYRYSDFALTNASVGVPEPAAVLGLGDPGGALLAAHLRADGLYAGLRGALRVAVPAHRALSHAGGAAAGGSSPLPPTPTARRFSAFRELDAIALDRMGSIRQAGLQ